MGKLLWWGEKNMKNHAAIKNTENLKASYLKRFKEKLGVNCQSIVVMYFFFLWSPAKK